MCDPVAATATGRAAINRYFGFLFSLNSDIAQHYADSEKKF
jgi:hypothetical protein